MKVNFVKEIVQAYMSQSNVYRRRLFDVVTKKTAYNFRIKASFTFLQLHSSLTLISLLTVQVHKEDFPENFHY